MFKPILFILIQSVVCLLRQQSAFAETALFHSWQEACLFAESRVEEGDLVFLDIPNPLFRRVAAGTNSWTSHVGVVFKDANSNWVVVESTIPFSKEGPLCKYLQRSSKFKFEVRRLNRRLTPIEVASLRSAAKGLLRKPYGLGFNFDSKRLFCSKLTYLAYRSIGIEVGRLQTFHQLLTENPSMSLRFWKYWFLGSIPWERRTVTPASQLVDPKFFTVLKSS